MYKMWKLYVENYTQVKVSKNKVLTNRELYCETDRQNINGDKLNGLVDIMFRNLGDTSS